VGNIWDPAFIDSSLDSRAVTFENPAGERGAGGTTHGGRKGAPSRSLSPGERVVLANLAGPGTVRHFWMTIPPAPPEQMRAVSLEVFYDDMTMPSISVPCLDYFGLPHGRPVPYDSALVSVHEGRGFNSYLPMPFADSIRIELINGSQRAVDLYYQIDYTLHRGAKSDGGYLHAAFRRENPTVQRRDFAIVDDLTGPGRFIGCNVGVRVIDPCDWYGEGEVKIYRDGDQELPTICGTGLEDYVGTAWGMGAYSAALAGAPLVLGPPAAAGNGLPPVEFVGFYRWHLPDPVMFERELRVTIQQLGAVFFGPGQEDEQAAYEQTNPVAGVGWRRFGPDGRVTAGICERVDDYCATAYVYCRHAQPVPRLDLAAALADIHRRDYESPHQMEAFW